MTELMFPNTLAMGEAFCNRVNEKKLLKQYIKSGVHTVVIAPRRYGKTSLINQVLLEAKLPYCLMELTMVTSAADLEEVVTKKAAELLYQILPRSAKLKQKLLRLFQFLHPEIVLSAAGQKIILHPEFNEQVDLVAETLKSLDLAAQEMNKRVVIVMDEFQEIENITNNNLEASIRHAMQYSKNVSYIFSGSKRHLLMNMFHDKNRPFYNACEVVYIDRIEREAYEPFIQSAAMKQFGKQIAANTLECIFKKSELYPAYVNRICGYFWNTNTFPDVDAVQAYWKDYVASRHSAFTSDILSLSPNQRRVLKHLAHLPCKKPYSKEFCVKYSMAEASVRQAVKKLLLMDLLYVDADGQHRVLDPAFRDYILQLEA